MSDTPITILDKIVEHASLRANKLAFIFLDSNLKERETLSYKELLQEVIKVACIIEQKKVKKGSRVLILQPPGLSTICVFFGCLWAGAIPIIGAIPRMGRSNSNFAAILKNSSPSLLFASEENFNEITAVVRSLYTNVETVCFNLKSYEAAEGARPFDIAEPAFVQYTSGSTGDPKGVCITHQNIVSNQEMIEYVFGHNAESTFVSWLPLYHDMGLVGTVLQPVWLGALSVQMSPTTFLQSPGKWLTAITKYKAHTSGGPNFAFDYCVSQISSEELSGFDLRGWRAAFNGAEPIRAETLNAFSTRFSSCGFERRAFLTCYGMAEATLLVSGKRDGKEPTIIKASRADLDRGRLTPSEDNENVIELVSSGNVAPGIEVLVLRQHGDETLPPGGVGEIAFRGPNVTPGYFEKNGYLGQKTTGSTKNVLFKSGDLGALLDGQLFIVGRSKDLIIFHGRNLHPHDIESAVAGCIGSKGFGATAVMQDPVDQTIWVVQEIRAKNPQEAQLLAIEEQIRESVYQEFDLSVDNVVFARYRQIPKTTSGKLSRAKCLQGIREGSLSVFPQGKTKTDTEDGLYSDHQIKQIQEIIEAVLGRTSYSEQTLAQRGLNSLKAVRLQYLLENRLKYYISLRDLSRAKTAVDILGFSKPSEVAPTHIRSVDNGVNCTLSETQRGIILAERTTASRSDYVLSVAGEVVGEPLDITRLERATKSVVQLVPILRTRISETDLTRTSFVESTVLEDLVKVVQITEKEEISDAIVEFHLREPIDLTKDLPFQIRVLTTPSGGQTMVVRCHHAVGDLNAVLLIFEKIAESYSKDCGQSGLSEGEYYAATGRGNNETRFNGDGLYSSENTDLFSLGALYRTKSDDVHGYGFVPFEFPEAVSSRIDTIISQWGASDFSMYLALLMLTLSRMTNQRTVEISSPFSTRIRPDFRFIIGPFVKLTSLNMNVDADQTYESFLRSLHEQVLDTYERLLVGDEIVRGGSGHIRKPSAMFTFQSLDDGRFEGAIDFALGRPDAKIEIGPFRLIGNSARWRPALADLDVAMGRVRDGSIAGYVTFPLTKIDPKIVESIVRNLLAIAANLTELVSPTVGEVASYGLDQETANFYRTSWQAKENPRTLLSRFLEIVETAPDSVAIRDGKNEVSYRLLDDRSTTLAHRLFRLLKSKA